MAEANDFVKEIQMMMFGLGDSQTPLLATAQVIQEIVKQQLTLLLDKANEIAEMRESPCIELQDIVFLLRKDSAKLKRLLQYLEMKDTKMGLPRLIAEMDPSKSAQNKRQTKGNRKEECIKFLSSIGIEYEDSVEDQVKMERLIRANQIAQSLNEKSYQELHKSRKCSFAATRLNQVKLIEWLKTSAEDDPVSKLKKDNIDVIVYFAKETVAQLIDLALLVRQDAIAVAGDPLSRAIDPLPTRSTDIYGCDKNLIPGPEPITVDEIRDVMRRFWSTNLYPFSTVTVNTFNPVDHRLLVC